MIARIIIKAMSVLAGAAFAMIVVVGCNPEEPAPPSAAAPAVKPGPTPAPGGAPSATPAAKEETKKP